MINIASQVAPECVINYQLQNDGNIIPLQKGVTSNYLVMNYKLPSYYRTLEDSIYVQPIYFNNWLSNLSLCEASETIG